MVHACELHVSESYLASFSTMNELYTTHRHMHIMDSYIKLHIDLQRGGERERERGRLEKYVTMSLCHIRMILFPLVLGGVQLLCSASAPEDEANWLILSCGVAPCHDHKLGAFPSSLVVHTWIYLAIFRR